LLLAVLDEVDFVGKAVFSPGVFHQHAILGVVVGVQNGDGLRDSTHV
jgi:hypothetical protein